ncbi:uncharacterized protein [Medicago truncatula]|uniref:uncharacterized protein n=1 Tax=Medicago truncatula TaxID=3880 RepID=UPI00196700B2|nr:uncharacterized protein LOC120578364 [Medicago truncatula]
MASVEKAQCIISVLNTYQEASGQIVNLDKSEVSYSRNVHNHEKEIICQRINIKTMNTYSRYLGLPVIFGRSKKEVFSFVQERVWKKIKGWKEKFFSRAGKETLIKAVAQAIPNYIMSYYKLLEGCCDAVEGMLAKFWWGSDEYKRKIHWMRWAGSEKLRRERAWALGLSLILTKLFLESNIGDLWLTIILLC